MTIVPLPPCRRVCCVIAMLALACGQASAQFSEKKGWAGGGNVPGEVNPSNASWYYSWWHTKPAGNPNAIADWVPLIKFVNGNFQNNLNIVAGYNDVDTLLVLNEPERADQSNVSVSTALSVWPQVQQTLPHLQLVAPSVSDNTAGRNWLSSFMSEVETRNANADPNDDLRVDAIGFHWYGGSTPNATQAANNFINSLNWYEQFNRPLWIKEFAIHDWGDNYTDEQILQANKEFLDIVIPELESRPSVAKYAYYSYFDDARLFTGSVPTPTVPGDSYVGTLQSGESYDLNGVGQPTDVIYTRGAELTNTGAALPEAIRAIDALEGSNTITGSSDWTVQGDSFVRVRSGASLNKTGANQVSFENATATVDGSFNINEGTIRAIGGSLEGSGVTRLAAGATLIAEASRGDDGYVVLGHDLEVEGTVTGSMQVKSGSVLTLRGAGMISDKLTISAATLSVGGQGFTETIPGVQPITTGLSLNYDASLDTPGDDAWSNDAGVAADALIFNGGVANQSAVNSASFPALTAAYSIPSTGGAGGLKNYFETAGPRSTNDATFEVVFNVDDTNAGIDQVLIEAGGTNRGVAMVLNDGVLTFNVDGNGSDINLTANLASGWHQAIGVIDIGGGGDTVSLYVNGALIGSLSGQNVVDWAGGNELGLGSGASSVTGVSSGTGAAYHSDIAIARYYANNAFDLTDVQQNYQALTTPFLPVATTATVGGDLIVNNAAVIELDVADAGVSDKLEILQDLVIFGGTLDVSYIGTAGLVAGDTYDLLDFASTVGDFASLSLPALDAGLKWDTSSLLVDGTLSVIFVGDYNGDGVVDGADYAVWRNTLGDTVTPFSGADGDGDGDITTLDFDVWRAAFGQSIAATASTLSAAPEPTTALLAVVLALAAAPLRFLPRHPRQR